MNWYKQSAKPKDVALTGTLRSNNGYIYLEVDSRLFAPFVNMIPVDSVTSPKDVTEPGKDVGAHISVMKKDETDGKTIKELGKEFEFFIDGLHSVKPDGWDEVKKVYFLTVKSPELEKLRKRYGLTKKIKGHEFHITVGVEKA